MELDLDTTSSHISTVLGLIHSMETAVFDDMERRFWSRVHQWSAMLSLSGTYKQTPVQEAELHQFACKLLERCDWGFGLVMARACDNLLACCSVCSTVINSKGISAFFCLAQVSCHFMSRAVAVCRFRVWMQDVSNLADYGDYSWSSGIMLPLSLLLPYYMHPWNYPFQILACVWAFLGSSEGWISCKWVCSCIYAAPRIMGN